MCSPREYAERSFGHPALHRLRQGVLALGTGFRAPAELPPLIDALLTPAQRDAWRALPPVDRAHLARVGGILYAEGERDPDLLVAGIFHDIGKHDEQAPVLLPHRVLCVLLERAAPAVIVRLRRSSSAPGLLRPLWISVHHAALGAAKAREIGCSARTCWLIAHHEDAPPVADHDLSALQRTDDLA